MSANTSEAAITAPANHLEDCLAILILPSGAPSLARLPRLDAVVSDFFELLVEELLLPRALALEAPHAVELLLAHLPRLLGDADVGAEDDAAEAVAHQPEVALRHVADEVARLAVVAVELLLVGRDVGLLGVDSSAAARPLAPRPEPRAG